MIRTDAISLQQPEQSPALVREHRGSHSHRRRLRGAAVAALVVAGSGTCTSSDTQLAAGRFSPLPQATQRLSDGFTIPRSFVERTDGLVLATDVAHREIWLVDFARGTRRPFGRQGDGPGEFRGILELLPLRGDSVAAVSAQIPYRVSIISGDGTPVRTRALSRFDSPAQAAFDFDQAPRLSRWDSSGRLYGSRAPVVGGANGLVYLDSVPIMRLDPNDDDIDTVAFSVVGEQAASRRPNGKDATYVLGKGVFAALNDWTVLRDGTVVTLDAGAYSLTFSSRSGASRTIPVRPAHSRTPISDRQWKRHLDSAAGALDARIRRSTAELSARLGAELGSRALSSNVRVPVRPEFWPPVLTSVSRMKLASDLLWIPVSGPESPVRQYWDIVGLDGAVQHSIVLDRGVFLLEVTSCWVYTTIRDDDDLFWVSRHPNPLTAASRDAENAPRGCASTHGLP
jgi:hypothetical protein